MLADTETFVKASDAINLFYTRKRRRKANIFFSYK